MSRVSWPLTWCSSHFLVSTTSYSYLLLGTIETESLSAPGSIKLGPKFYCVSLLLPSLLVSTLRGILLYFCTSIFPHVVLSLLFFLRLFVCEIKQSYACRLIMPISYVLSITLEWYQWNFFFFFSFFR